MTTPTSSTARSMNSSGANEVRRDLTKLLPRLWRFAIYLTRSNASAEDLVQSTCVRALEKATQYTANTKLDSWVFSIMASIWKNSLRAGARITTDESVDVDAIPFTGINVAELTTFAQQVLDSVSRLPEGQRAVVALVCVERWSYKEAADTLDIPIGTVMSRLANARKALAPLNADDPDRCSSTGAGRS